MREGIMHRVALRRLRTKRTSELGPVDGGFTLIELMVVLLIIAILLAIAIPTFLGVTSSADDRSAQSNLSNGLTEATAQYENAGETYSGISALLSASAPEFTRTASSSPCTTLTANCISVYSVDVASSTDQQGLIVAAMSKTGTCWWVARLQATPTVLATPGFDTSTSTQSGAATAGTFYAKKSNAGSTNCKATYPESQTTFTWGTSFQTAGSN
jgi:type IV pilus assembly protein PilA